MDESIKQRLVKNRWSGLGLFVIGLLFLGASLFLSMAQTFPAQSMPITGLPAEAQVLALQTSFDAGIDVDASDVYRVERASQAWQLVFANSFEGTLSIGDWDARDGNGSVGGEYYWNHTVYTSASFSHSLWAIGGGAQGSSLDPAVDVYPDGVDSQFIIGPIDLSQVVETELDFQLQMLAQPGDQLQVLSSNDGQNWEGVSIVLDGLSATDWFSVTAHPDRFVGDSSVWFVIRFLSDEDGLGDTGVFIDDVYLRVKSGHRGYLPIVLRQATATLPPTSTSLPTATSEPTPEVPVIKVIQVYRGSGLFPVNQEYAVIQNQGAASQNMTGWQLSDEEDAVYTFPQFTLEPGASVKVWSKCGYDSETDLFRCGSRPMWDAHDTAYLHDQNGTLIDAYSY